MRNLIKNIPGWRTDRKLIIFAVDDYCNVRIDSEKSRDFILKNSKKKPNRFDLFDSLECREDLEVLYETLSGVKDRNGKHAVFTVYANPCNIDFEEIIKNEYSAYAYESVIDTFEKQSNRYPSAYDGTWGLWLEGVNNGYLVPQYHGREHLNVKYFNKRLESKDPFIQSLIMNRSYAFVERDTGSEINPLAAYQFDKLSENEELSQILSIGIDQFKETFGITPSNFTPPVYSIHPSHYENLYKRGIRYIDTDMLNSIHMGDGIYKRVFNYTGKKDKSGVILIIRNAAFEPTDNSVTDWCGHTLNQISAAFKMKKPAIISSHRINYCGFISEENRRLGISKLNELLESIVKTWSDVEFIDAQSLGDLIQE